MKKSKRRRQSVVNGRAGGNSHQPVATSPDAEEPGDAAADAVPSEVGTDTNSANQILDRLRDEFASVLEESVIIAIANDFNLPGDLEIVRGMLSQLAETAPAEAASGFDASGLGSLADPETSRREETITSGDGPESSWAENATSFSEYSDDKWENRCVTSPADLTDEQKLQELRVVFQDRWKDHTLQHALKSSNGSLEDALDALLNRQYLEESGEYMKGVDAFFVDDEDEGGVPKGKSQRQRKQKAPKKKVVPIAYKAVSSSGTDDDAELQSAKDFAASKPTPRQPVALPMRPLITIPRPITTSLPTSPTSPGTGPSSGFSTPITPDALDHSLRAAAQLRRMGPLGRQGAVVYTERFQSARAALAEQASREAEALVERRSSATLVDLHGVFVMDGVRIARTKLWGWWNGLDPEGRKDLARRGEGFTVVTGIGKHSEGGVSRMRQAVGAYLKNDGWKFETLTGKFLVTGRV